LRKRSLRNKIRPAGDVVLDAAEGSGTRDRLPQMLPGLTPVVRGDRAPAPAATGTWPAAITARGASTCRSRRTRFPRRIQRPAPDLVARLTQCFGAGARYRPCVPGPYDFFTRVVRLTRGAVDQWGKLRSERVCCALEVMSGCKGRRDPLAGREETSVLARADHRTSAGRAMTVPGTGLRRGEARGQSRDVVGRLSETAAARNASR